MPASKLAAALAILGTALLVALLATPLTASESTSAQPAATSLRDEVESVERAFAKTMADRDHDAFSSFLSGEAIFISGPVTLRGKQQVAAAWKPFFDGPEAPFSWEPETVEVNDSGTLALSSGPVFTPQGDLVATFTSIWEQEEPGVWRIVFDKGNQACPPPAPAPEAPEAEKPEDTGE